MENQSKKKGIRVYLPLIGIIAVVLVVSGWWYREYTMYIKTDDARIDADMVTISPKMMGRLTKLYFDEGDSVKAGTLMAELDSSDLVAQRYQVVMQREQAIANQTQSEARYRYDVENLKVLTVAFDRAKEDLERAKNQYDGDVITKEQLDHFQKNFESARAQLDAGKVQLNVSKAQVGVAQASVETSVAQIGVVTSQLNNSRVVAPMNGVVVKRWLLQGDVVQPGQSIFSVANNQKLWVTIYLEETYVSEVHIGQKAVFTIDAFPGVEFNGQVTLVGSNTASLFSLIPANNASGNFTKVTQRVPVRISIEGADKGNLSQYRLFTGMSVVAKLIRE
jgi:membrane fusion protein (multidrug efflux system)